MASSSSSAALRDTPQSPRNGRDGARPSKKSCQGSVVGVAAFPCIGGPRSLVAAGECGFPWRAMLRHGRLFFGRLTGHTAKPQKRTRRSASLQEELPGVSSWGGGVSLHWRATVARGRGRIRRSLEGHAPSWPPLLLRPPYRTHRKASETDATERVPPGGNDHESVK